MTVPELRPYQVDVIAEFHRHVAFGHRRIILVAPTGSGKTVIGSDIIRTTACQHKYVLVLAHRREIIQQTSDKLHANDITHGIIQAGFPMRPLEAVQVASIQTLCRRAFNSERIDLPPADLLVIDEAHHCPAQTYRKIVDAYPNAVLLGLTATPCRGDGRGLGGIFDMLIECPQVAQLIEQSYLVRTRVYAPVDPDLRGVQTRAGDYVESQLAERMDHANLIGDIVANCTSSVSGARPFASPSALATPSISWTNSSNPASAPNTSTAPRLRPSGIRRSRGSHPARSSS
jgi:superfamily II DNA or RNA helicase